MFFTAMGLAPYGVSNVWSGLKYLDSQRIYWRNENIEILDGDRQLQPVQLRCWTTGWWM